MNGDDFNFDDFDDFDDEDDEEERNQNQNIDILKKLVEALFKGLGGAVEGQDSLGGALYPAAEVKVPLFEAHQEGKKVNVLFEMPGALEEDIVFSISGEFGNKFLLVSTADSLGEKYKAVLTLPDAVKKVTKEHFTNGVLELVLT